MKISFVSNLESSVPSVGISALDFGTLANFVRKPVAEKETCVTQKVSGDDLCLFADE
jgi:hypothetical protein